MPTPPGPQLAQLGFQLIAPSPALRPYVQSLWRFQRDTALLAYQEQYMHPRGGFGLVFNFGDHVHLDGRAVPDPLFLDGTTTISRKMGFLGRVDLLGVRFHEGGAYPVLGVPLGELRNQTGLLDALERPQLLRLHAQLEAAPSLAERVSLLESWLAQRLALGRQRSPLIAASLAWLRASAGQAAIPALARQFAVGQRQLERLYQSQVGMSPKQYVQLLRVEAARLALKRLPGRATADLAAELGFYDQAHFTHVFRAVVGIPPATYLKRSREQG